MSGLISQCYYGVCGEPDYPEAFENISTQYHNNTIIPNFNVKICVRFTQRCGCGCGLTSIINNIPSPPVSSHCISCTEFFQNGSSFLRRCLSHHLLPSEMLDLLIPKLIVTARHYIDNDSSYPSVSEEGLGVVPLCIDMIVELEENVDLEHADDTDDQIRMIPTSEKVIQALNQMKLEDDADIDIDSNQKNECCICLEDFCDNGEVSTLP